MNDFKHALEDVQCCFFIQDFLWKYLHNTFIAKHWKLHCWIIDLFAIDRYVLKMVPASLQNATPLLSIAKILVPPPYFIVRRYCYKKTKQRRGKPCCIGSTIVHVAALSTTMYEVLAHLRARYFLPKELHRWSSTTWLHS